MIVCIFLCHFGLIINKSNEKNRGRGEKNFICFQKKEEDSMNDLNYTTSFKNSGVKNANDFNNTYYESI